MKWFKTLGKRWLVALIVLAVAGTLVVVLFMQHRKPNCEQILGDPASLQQELTPEVAKCLGAF